jgi:hypothetical protein
MDDLKEFLNYMQQQEVKVIKIVAAAVMMERRMSIFRMLEG